MRTFTQVVGIGAVTLVACACAFDTETSQSEAESVDEPTSALSAEDATPEVTPTPVATIDVGQGRTVEFYALDNGVDFISETGPAGVDSALDELDPAVDQSNYIELHRALRPDLKVPDVLVSVQARRGDEPTGSVPRPKKAAVRPAEISSTSSTTSTSSTGSTGSTMSTSQAISIAEACNNGCCYQPWVLESMCWGAIGLEYYHPDSPWSQPQQVRSQMVL
jgi:hypothetical protein